MKTIKIICDKCNKDITTNSYKIPVIIGNVNNPMHEFDFCDKCYGDFIRTVGSYIKGE